MRDKMTRRDVEGDTRRVTVVCVCVRKGSPLIMYHNITSFSLPPPSPRPQTLRIYATRYDRLTPYITVYTCLRAVFYVPARITVVYATGSRLSHFFTSHDRFLAVTVAQGIRYPSVGGYQNKLKTKPYATLVYYFKNAQLGTLKFL